MIARVILASAMFSVRKARAIGYTEQKRARLHLTVPELLQRPQTNAYHMISIAPLILLPARGRASLVFFVNKTPIATVAYAASSGAMSVRNQALLAFRTPVATKL